MIEYRYNFFKKSMSDFNFERFEARNVRVEKRITITKSESIGFPTGFHKSEGLEGQKFVTLFYDRKNKAIGIQFTNEEKAESSFSLAHNKRGYGAGIVARSFFKANDIDTKKYYGRYDWKKQFVGGIGNMYIIELKERQ